MCIELIPNVFINWKICTNIVFSAYHIFPEIFWLLVFLQFCENICTIAKIALPWVCYFILIFNYETFFETAKKEVSCCLSWIFYFILNKAGLWRWWIFSRRPRNRRLTKNQCYTQHVLKVNRLSLMKLTGVWQLKS